MRAERLLSILLLLQSRQKMTTHELAEALEISRRTVLRDIDALSAARIPVYSQKGPGGGLYLDSQYKLILSGFQQSELRGMFASGIPQLLSEIGLNEPTEDAALKLFAALPGLHQRSIRDFQQRIHIDPKWWWYEEQPAAFWPVLQEAVYTDRCIRVIYEKHNGEIQERTLEPYSLVAKAAVWYLVARRDGEFRTYRVSRFHDVQITDQSFTRDADFDLSAFWQQHLQTTREYLPHFQCVLRVLQKDMGFLRYYVPGNAEIIEQPSEDGEYLRVELRVGDLHIARMLVLGLDGRAEVIEPDELRRAVLHSAQQNVEHFTRTDQMDHVDQGQSGTQPR